MDLSLGLEGTHVVVTGAGGFIGTEVAKTFLAAGAVISAFEIHENKMTYHHERLHWLTVNITSEKDMEEAFQKATQAHGVISVCVALAGLDLSYLPQHDSICDMSLEQWQKTNKVNAEGTFLTARSWLKGIRDHAKVDTRNISLVIIGSESGTFGVTGNADYAASKSAIQYGLVRSMVKDVVAIHHRARVNAIAPGPVDTPQFRKECAEGKWTKWLDSEATVAMKTAVPMEAVARSCLFLASESWSGNITGQVLPVDSGKSGKVHWLPHELTLK